MLRSLVGSEMCIRDSNNNLNATTTTYIDAGVNSTSAASMQQSGGDAVDDSSEGEDDEDTEEEEEEEEELSWQWWLSESCALDFAPAFIVSSHRMLYPSCFNGSVVPSISSLLSEQQQPLSMTSIPWRASILTSTLLSAKTAAELGDVNAQFFLGKLLLSMAASGSAVIKYQSDTHHHDEQQHHQLQLASNLFFQILSVSPSPTSADSSLSSTHLSHLTTSVLPEFQQAKLRGLYWLREASQGLSLIHI
eukprot:TRINITY_DN12155_c0_g1_i1.p1 TRINITY_DN12155_c0_g1~~TRINITY_DN12155_c0_g1_i1.p1  ORF type:complete len:278 (+),score=76.02 TRINITY_DN12155_c0_g1_i1:89-835(+)